eukprot:3495057-Pyramimonas_sp.AAC.1
MSLKRPPRAPLKSPRRQQSLQFHRTICVFSIFVFPVLTASATVQEAPQEAPRPLTRPQTRPKKRAPRRSTCAPR